jgi:uncharacterized membrane protein
MQLGPPEIIIIAIAVATLIGLLMFWPSGDAAARARSDLSVLGIPSEFHEATISAVDEYACGANGLACILVTFEITTGPDAGRLFTQEFPLISTTPVFKPGNVVVLSRVTPPGSVTSLDTRPCEFDATEECVQATLDLIGGGTEQVLLFPGQEQGLIVGGDVHITYETDGSIIAISAATVQTSYQYADSQRRPYLFILFLVFAASVIALGRIRGAAALVGIGLSLVVIVGWLIPSLLDGNSASIVALVAASAVAFLALYLSHGFTRVTTVALLGTVAAIALTTALSAITVVAGNFTGFTSEETTLLLLLGGVDIKSILLAGIVIGAAGALDDVTVTQSASVNQLRRTDPTLPAAELFRRGMEIGKAHVGSIVNTLVLAYMGAALPLAILFIVAEQSFGTVLNSEVVAIEVTRAIVGTIGIIAAVPLTTWFATIWPASADIHSH